MTPHIHHLTIPFRPKVLQPPNLSSQTHQATSSHLTSHPFPYPLSPLSNIHLSHLAPCTMHHPPLHPAPCIMHHQSSIPPLLPPPPRKKEKKKKTKIPLPPSSPSPPKEKKEEEKKTNKTSPAPATWGIFQEKQRKNGSQGCGSTGEESV